MKVGHGHWSLKRMHVGFHLQRSDGPMDLRQVRSLFGWLYRKNAVVRSDFALIQTWGLTFIKRKSRGPSQASPTLLESGLSAATRSASESVASFSEITFSPGYRNSLSRTELHKLRFQLADLATKNRSIFP